MAFEITITHYRWTPEETTFRFNDVATLVVKNGVVPCPVTKLGVQEVVLNDTEKSIHYERGTGTLSSEELEKIQNQVRSLVANSSALVHAYSPERNNAYAGSVPLSVLYNAGDTNFVPIKPSSNAAYWDEEKGEWKIIHAVIYEDGHWATNVSGICPSCTLVFTEEEWKAQERIPEYYEVWDFTQEKWVDGRNIEEVREVRLFDIVEEIYPSPGANSSMSEADYLIEGPENSHIVQEFTRLHAGAIETESMVYTKIFAETLGVPVEEVVEQFSTPIKTGLDYRARKTGLLLKVRKRLKECKTIEEIEKVSVMDFMD